MLDLLEPRLLFCVPIVKNLVMVVNDADRNANHIADFADGYSHGIVSSPTANGADNFTPITFTVPSATGSSESLIIGYDGSDPTHVTGNTTNGYKPAGGSGGNNTGMLRLWDKNGNVLRDGRAFGSGGDYLTPGTYSYSSLGLEAGHTYTYFVEAIRPSKELWDRKINLTFKINGSDHQINQYNVTNLQDAPASFSAAGLAGGEAAHSTGGDPMASAYSGPVRLADGTVSVSATDFASAGYGTAWDQARSFSDQLVNLLNPVNGNGWTDSSLPWLQDANPSIVVVGGSKQDFYFDKHTDNTFNARFFTLDKLAASGSDYALTDTQGDVYKFHDFSTSLPARERGKFESFTDAAGNAITTDYDSSGNLTDLHRNGGLENWHFTNNAPSGSGEEAHAQVHSVTVTRGSKTIDTVTYTYDHENLTRATTTDISGSSKTWLYRYAASASAGGMIAPSRLEDVVSPQTYARLPGGASVTQADLHFTYYNAGQSGASNAYLGGVKTVAIQGAGASATGNNSTQGTYSYKFSENGDDIGIHDWDHKTIIKAPDQNETTYFSNYGGEVMLSEFADSHDANPDLRGGKRVTFYGYDDAGRSILLATQPAIPPYTDADPTLLGFSESTDGSTGTYTNLHSSWGLIAVTEYYTTGAVGYVKDTALKYGNGGTPVKQTDLVYTSSTSGTIHPVASATVYQQADGTHPETTGYAYIYSGDQITQMTTTPPACPSDQSAAGTGNTITHYNSFGYADAFTDPDGYLTTYVYDNPTGTVKGTDQVVDGTQHIITSTERDDLGRAKTYTDGNEQVTHYDYLDNATDHQVRIRPPTGPATVTDDNWHTGAVAQMIIGGGKLQSLMVTRTDLGGRIRESDRYFKLEYVHPALNEWGESWNVAGNLGDFYETDYGYDISGRQNRTVDPVGTITRTVLDGLGRVYTTWIGTRDADPTGASPGGNMTRVDQKSYDLTSANISEPNWESVGTGVSQVSTVNYFDWRGREIASQTGSASDHAPITYDVLDNLGDVVQRDVFDSNTNPGSSLTDANFDGVLDMPAETGGGLRAKTTTEYDLRGRVQKSSTFSVAPSYNSSNVITGSTLSSDAAVTKNFYDGRGDVIAVSSPGGLWTKAHYDGEGRPTNTYVTDGAGGSSAAATVTGDHVFTQTETAYDDDGNPIFVTTKARFHNATGAGALGTAASGVRARVSYLSNYYDNADRLIETINYGTNGGTPPSPSSTAPLPYVAGTASAATATTLTDLSRSEASGSFVGWGIAIAYGTAVRFGVVTGYNLAAHMFTISGLTAAPASGARYTLRRDGWDQQLVATRQYGDNGLVSISTDPRGIANWKKYDPAGRVTTNIDAYNASSIAVSDSQNRTTHYKYDGLDHVTDSTQDLPDGSSTNSFVYGVNPTSGSDLSSYDLLYNIRTPANNSGGTGSIEDKLLSYNALGQLKTSKDGRGVTHTYSYDSLGRKTKDAASFDAVDSSVDRAVTSISTEYDAFGRPYRFTTARASEDLNQVVRRYNGFGQIVAEQQNSGGDVATSSPGVGYGYSSGATGGLLNSMTYPDGRVIGYARDGVGRVSSVTEGTAALETYQYLGLDTIVGRSRPEAELTLNYFGNSGTPLAPGSATADGGDQYTGLDRFGRVIDQAWTQSSGGTTTYVDRFQFAYDADSNKLYQNNMLHASLSELYQADGASAAEAYGLDAGYDALNRSRSFKRGTLSSSTSGGRLNTTPSSGYQDSEIWNWDAQGKLITFNDSGAGHGNVRLTNQVYVATAAGDQVPLAGDKAHRDAKFDAWGRITFTYYSNGTSSGYQKYHYDALGRVISIEHDSTEFFHSLDGSVIAESPAAAPFKDQVYSPVDGEMIASLTAVHLVTSRRATYPLQNADGSVTSIVQFDSGASAGPPIERYLYSPTGFQTALTGSWAAESLVAGMNEKGWLYLYHGMRADDETGLYNSAGKAYDPFTSRVLDWHQHQYFLHSSSFEFPPEAYDPHMEAFDADPYHLYAGLGWAGSALLAVGTGGLSLTVEGVLVFSLEQGLMRAAEAALIGGVIGGVDSWLHVDANGEHGDFGAGAFNGSQFAMRLSGVASGLGALGVSAQALWGLGVAANVGLTGVGAYDSFSQDQTAQGLFRVGVGLAFGMQQFGSARSGPELSAAESAGVIAEGNPVIDGLSSLPSRGTSEYLGPTRPSIGQVTSLAERTNWEREIAVTYKPGPGLSGRGGDYYLWSSPYDSAGNAVTTFPEDHFVVYHTHVTDAFASKFDMNWMATNPNGQNSSIIIHRTEGAFGFTATEPNFPLVNGRR